MAFDFIAGKLETQKEINLYRSCSVAQNKQGRFIQVDSKTYLNFSSNDYLGLASDPALIQAWKEGADLYGVGSAGSPLVTGFKQAHFNLIDDIKKWLDVEAVALFSSGYSANQAIIKLLLSKGDLLIQDKLNHASLMEAGSLSACEMKRFKHNDTEHLKQILSRASADNKLIISEGIFSMDGDKAPITELLTIAKQSKSWLMIDDAHGLGVLGEQGKGAVNAAGLNVKDCELYIATFGKALGVGGAFVSGSQSFIDYLTNFSKPYIYSTSIPPAMAHCISASIKKVQTEQWRRDKLNSLIQTFKEQAKVLGIEVGNSETAIQPVIIGSAKKTLQISEQLREKGFWVGAIRPPTVAKNSARLRITLTVHHETSDIKKLLETLASLLKQER